MTAPPLKKLLIISPHFPPINGADMHRVRQSLLYYAELGWEPTVVCVDPSRVEAAQDELLVQSIPPQVRVIRVGAFSTRITRKFGLGSLGLRSLLFYWWRVNQLLKTEKFDLIFFSTTQFPVLVLGNYWRKRFGVPYVIDMQDPWHSEYYRNKPRHERPPKYWFVYPLNKYLERIAMRRVSAIIAVSAAYHQTLRERYPWIQAAQCHTLTFGAFEKDFEIAAQSEALPLNSAPNEKKVVYIGRGGADMQRALHLIFRAVQMGLAAGDPHFSALRFYFLGTSYAPPGQGVASMAPVAQAYGLADRVEEHTDRLPYFQSLKTLQSADFLLVPGSDDPQYSASKIYPYILSQKPIIAVFHEASSVVDLLEATQAGLVQTFGPGNNGDQAATELYQKWATLLQNPNPSLNWSAFAPHLAQAKTQVQVAIFNSVVTAP